MNFIGQGSDIHKLKKTWKQGPVVLGGFPFLSKYKVVAHSDGDIVLHSISNAILGCVGSGDIGEYFSDCDPKNKNLSSTKILEKSLAILKAKNQTISNVDLTIICEKIFIKQFKKEIKQSLVKLLNCSNVNVKATRFEKNINYIQCESVVLTATNII